MNKHFCQSRYSVLHYEDNTSALHWILNSVVVVKGILSKANVVEGFSMYGHDVRTGKARVEKWLKKLDYPGK